MSDQQNFHQLKRAAFVEFIPDFNPYSNRQWFQQRPYIWGEWSGKVQMAWGVALILKENQSSDQIASCSYLCSLLLIHYFFCLSARLSFILTSASLTDIDWSVVASVIAAADGGAIIYMYMCILLYSRLGIVKLPCYRISLPVGKAASPKGPCQSRGLALQTTAASCFSTLTPKCLLLGRGSFATLRCLLFVLQQYQRRMHPRSLPKPATLSRPTV